MKLTETGTEGIAGQGESQWEAQMQEQLLEALEDYRRGIADAPACSSGACWEQSPQLRRPIGRGRSLATKAVP